ncbi:amidohydrolase [Actomonas aquatica]|uniref:Amidohydrolase n=1 Tax=Actomonas aquatica TaxID=2866162 RepID=A0ABZ1CFJ7_9BACT|nr:amidohydrolase [Opitutus sp. WL0086]WRQ89055.1 amidohydrolase [Opitutus sp. WL0086]
MTALGVSGQADPADKQAVIGRLDERTAHYGEMAHEIWSLAEVGYQEFKSTRLLQDELAAAGFSIEAGVAGMPTAFIASYGEGEPIIGMLGEYDALPGVLQTASPERELRTDGAIAGHACGHHLFGTGSAAAAVAVKEWMAANNVKGTLRYYGCPAEEGGSGKVYLVRAGKFDDASAVLHWHAGDRNGVGMGSSMANKSAKFRFHGVSSHAAGAPERGRSALDGVEALNFMANLMREHVPSDTRIHYVITKGGEAPNVVPDFAEVFYYVRNPDRRVIQDVWGRLEAAAQGAAAGTGTTVDWEIIHGNYELLPNEPLGRTMWENLELVGGVTYDDAEREFAERIGATLPGGRAAALEVAAQVQPFRPKSPPFPASTDVADISWTVPTIGLGTATWVPGTPGHSWQAVAAGGMSIGTKGMMVAAKTLALTAMDLFTDAEILAAASDDLEARRGADFHYEPLLGDRPPPLDYRK